MGDTEEIINAITHDLAYIATFGDNVSCRQGQYWIRVSGCVDDHGKEVITSFISSKGFRSAWLSDDEICIQLYV